MLIDTLISQIEHGKINPVYFLYGEEAFFHTEIIAALVRKLINPENRDFNLETFEGQNSAANDWIGAVKTFSFMGGRKLVIVRGLDEANLSDNGVQALLDYVKAPVEEACLVMTALKADRKRKLFKELTKGGIDCDSPGEAELMPWLKKRAKEQGYTLSPRAATLMVDRIGPKPGILNGELGKLLAYAGEENTITEDHVAELVGDIKLENAFALTEALKEKKAEKALQLLHNQLDHGEDPIKVLGTIIWQFRTLWEVKHYQQKKLPPSLIAEHMGAKPFLVEKAMKHTGNFTRQHLRKGYQYLEQADRELKTTGKDPQGILETLVLLLCSDRR